MVGAVAYHGQLNTQITKAEANRLEAGGLNLVMESKFNVLFSIFQYKYLILCHSALVLSLYLSCHWKSYLHFPCTLF